MRPLLLVRNKMGDENSIANETFAQAVRVFESAWVWCVKSGSRFDNEIIHDLVGRIIAAHDREAKGVSDGTHSDMPITTDLRKTLARIDAYNSTNVSELVEDNLNAIDSVHENLEIEYSELVEQADCSDDSKEIAKLESELKTQRNNFEQDWKNLYEASQDECRRLAESIKQLESERDEEHDKVNWLHAELKELEERSIKLPKDADDEYINIGDVMVYADGNTCPLPVVAIVSPTVFLTDEGPRYADMCRHYTPDTWERIEEDARKAMSLYSMPNVVMTLIARCKALAGDAS